MQGDVSSGPLGNSNNAHLISRDQLRNNFRKDVRLAKNLDFFLVDFDFGPAVFGKQNFVANRHRDW